MKEQHRDGRGFRWVEDGVARRALRRAHVAARSGPRLDCGDHAGPRHRRQHRALQRDRCADAATIAGHETRRAPVVHDRPLDSDSGLSAFPIRSTRTFRRRRMPSRVSSPQGTSIRCVWPWAGRAAGRTSPAARECRATSSRSSTLLPRQVACWFPRTMMRLDLSPLPSSATGSGLDASGATRVSSAGRSRSTTCRSRLLASRQVVSTASRSAPIRTSGGPLV